MSDKAPKASDERPQLAQDGPGPPQAGPEPVGALAGASDACARAVAVAVLAALPAGLRTGAAGGSMAEGWLVAAGVALPFVAAAILFAGAAGRGFRYLTVQRLPRAVVLGLALWIGLAVGPLAVLASMLKETTHHHGLGGATFGALGLALVAFAALCARKLVSIGDTFLERGAPPALVAGVGAVIAVVPMLFAAAPVGARGGLPGDGSLRAAVLDGAILLVATALAASVDLREAARKTAARVGFPVALVVALGATARVASAHGEPSVKKAGGLAGAVLGAFDRSPAAKTDGP